MVRLWNADTYAECGVIQDHNAIGTVCFLPDGRLVYSSGTYATGSAVTICAIQRTPPEQLLVSNSEPPFETTIESVALAQMGDGRLLACAISPTTKSVRLWRVDNQQLAELQFIVPGFTPGDIAALPKGRLVVGSFDGPDVVIYDLLGMQPKQHQRLVTMTARCADKVVVSKDGKVLCRGMSRWQNSDLEAGRERSLRSHHAGVQSSRWECRWHDVPPIQ